MTFRLIDDATINFEGYQIEHGVYRQNGDTCTLSEPERVITTVTLDDGREVEELRLTGRSKQVDQLREIEVKAGRKDGQIVVTGTSVEAINAGLPPDELMVTVIVTPGPGCQNCG